MTSNKSELAKTTFLFIGGGNMAKALVLGLLNNNVQAEDITVVDPDSDKRHSLATELAIKVMSNTELKSLTQDCIFLCVKPQIMQSVCSSLKDLPCNSNSVFISVAAGITLDQLKHWLNTDSPIVRTMPNTPALISQGATGLYTDDPLSEAQTETINTLFNNIGISIWCNSENDLNTVTALSGSGPAYYFQLFESMHTAALELGLHEDDAKQLILQTAIGAAMMATLTDEDFQTLRENVTSKGGTTAAGLAVFAQEGFDQIIQTAIKAAHARSIELSQ